MVVIRLFGGMDNNGNTKAINILVDDKGRVVEVRQEYHRRNWIEYKAITVKVGNSEFRRWKNICDREATYYKKLELEWLYGGQRFVQGK